MASLIKTETKVCLICGKEYSKNRDISNKQWYASKFCSLVCKSKKTPWNKGLKKTQSPNKGSFQKGIRSNINTEFDGSYSKEKHWNWKGGITSEARLIRNSPEYSRWRISVFERDNYACVWCGTKSGNGKAVVLHADHIKPFSLFPELRLELSNGRTLCKQCHQFTATYMGRLTRFNKKPSLFRPRIDRVEYGGAVVGPEELDAVMSTMLSSGGKRWTVGPESIAFEEELALVAGVKKAVVVNSGSSALLVAIAALKLPKGSKIIIPACNFPTAFNAIIQNGHMPVVVDVDLETLNLSLDEVSTALELHPDIAAVIAVDIAGNPVDLIKLREIVGKRKIILDDCDGFGTLLNGKMIEQYADVACASFHAAHIITTGEGGAVFTNDEEVGARAAKMREWGRASGTDNIYKYEGFPDDYKERYVYEEIGWNLKPLELQCAMGRIQLKKLSDFRTARRSRYDSLQAIFDNYRDQFTVITNKLNANPCWFSFPVLVKGLKRGEVMKQFEDNNIECRTIFSGNILRHPAYKDIEVIKIGNLENSDIVMRDGMFLSCHPSLNLEMLDFISQVVKDICK